MAQPKPASSGAAHTLPYNRLSPRQFEERRWVFQCKRVERFSPAPPDHFVGRERELSDLARALTDSDQPQAITALQGMGGIGKTALAKKLAADLDGQLPGGIFWADLPASEGDPLPILAAWGRACGHHLADLADPQARAAARGCLAAHLQAHGRAHRQPTAADYDALEAERTNLLAALDRADRAAQWPAVRRFVWALGAAGGYLWVRGYWGELRKRLAQAVRAAQAEGNKWETAAFVHPKKHNKYLQVFRFHLQNSQL